MVERQVLVLGGDGGICRTRNKPKRVVIRAIAEEDHAELIAIGLLEPQDVCVELDGPLDVRDMEQNMADLARANTGVAMSSPFVVAAGKYTLTG
jgi:hypothetical protein